MSGLQLSALFLFLLNTLGLLLHSQLIPRGRIRAGMFCFYTNQSNLLLTVYELLLFCACFYPGGGLWAALTDVRVSCAMALCIWVTHLIYQFVLVPYEKRKGLKFADFGGNFGNLCVHYFTPLLAVMQWLLFAPKENLSILCRLVADPASELYRLCPAPGQRGKAHRPHGPALPLPFHGPATPGLGKTPAQRRDASDPILPPGLHVSRTGIFSRINDDLHEAPGCNAPGGCGSIF